MTHTNDIGAFVRDCLEACGEERIDRWDWSKPHDNRRIEDGQNVHVTDVDASDGLFNLRVTLSTREIFQITVTRIG